MCIWVWMQVCYYTTMVHVVQVKGLEYFQYEEDKIHCAWGLIWCQGSQVDTASRSVQHIATAHKHEHHVLTTRCISCF